MNRLSIGPIFAGFALLLGLVIPSTAQGVDVEERVKALKAIIPLRPKVISGTDVMVMRKAGETKRVDAAVFLIQSLGFNRLPGANDEIPTPEQMIPAIPILKEFFGPSVVPLILAEGLRDDIEPWYRIRLAFALQCIEPSSGGRRGSLDAVWAGAPSSERLKVLVELVENKNLKVEYAGLEPLILTIPAAIPAPPVGNR